MYNIVSVDTIRHIILFVNLYFYKIRVLNGNCIKVHGFMAQNNGLPAQTVSLFLHYIDQMIEPMVAIILLNSHRSQ